MASIPEGTWTLVGDGIITSSVDVEFEILHRRDGVDDVLVASWTHHFDPRGGGDFTPIEYEETAQGAAVDFEAGDQLIFRYTGTGTDTPMAYIPNGEATNLGGRFPHILLPD